VVRQGLRRARDADGALHQSQTFVVGGLDGRLSVGRRVSVGAEGVREVGEHRGASHIIVDWSHYEACKMCDLDRQF
jgi:hypothetical protein